MRTWLSEHVVGLAALAAGLDLVLRWHMSFGAGMINAALMERNISYRESDWILQLVTYADFAASLAWWAFLFALLFRVIGFFEASR